MPPPMSATEMLDREFLTIRCRLIEVAAALDRMNRAGGSIGDDARWKNIRRSLEVLARTDGQRAEEIQHIFSLPYDPDWRQP